MAKIILVEDQKEYREYLSQFLIKEGFNVSVASDAITGIEFLAKNKYDLIITDLHLDVVDGVRLIGTAKEIHPDIKTMIITDESANASELADLRVNVDVYLEKNRSIDVILAYVNKLIKKKKEVEKELVVLHSKEEELTMDLKSHTVVQHGNLIDLTPKEFEVLRIFLTKMNSVVSRDEMISIVWNEEVISDNSRVVDVHVQKLREKLQTRVIQTVR